MLKSKGYKYETISVDRVDQDHICKPYLTLKNAIYEERLQIYKTYLLKEELIGLERNNNGKVDHGPSGINCFTGDTKIRLVDGRSLTILELLKEFNLGKENFVYSFNEKKQVIEPKLIENVFCSGHNASLIKVTLDNGEQVKCTPEHRFMLRNGTYCEAKDLLPGDSLMPLYTRYPSKGLSEYRMYYEPVEDKWHYEHRKFAEEVLDERYLVHHKDCNPKNNNPTNLVWCSKKMHQSIHAEMQTGAQSIEAKKKRSNSLKTTYEIDKQKEDYYVRWYNNCSPEEAKVLHEKQIGRIEENQKRIEKINELFNIDYESLDTSSKRSYSSSYNNYLRGYDIFTDKYKKVEEKRNACQEYYNVNYNTLDEHTRRSLSIKYAREVDPTYQERVSKKVSENHAKGKYENAKKALDKCNQRSKMLKQLFPEIDKQKFFELFGLEYDSIDKHCRAPWVNRYRQKLYEVLNHKVVSIEFIPEREDVYDLTIKDNHNFALDAGVFVHNSKDTADALCGAIYNASKHAEEFAFEFGEDIDATIKSSQSTSLQAQQKQIVVDFEKELKRIQDPLKNNIKKEENIFMDFGMGRANPYVNSAYLSQGIIL